MDALVERNAKLMHVAMRGMQIGSPLIGDEMRAAALVGIWQGLKTRTRTNVSTLPVMRARGAVIDYLRWLTRFDRKSRSTKSPTVQIVDELTVRDGGQGQVDVRELLEAATKRLTRQELHVIRRHYLDGLLLQDVAAELGVHPTQVSHYHRAALNKLRAFLGEVDEC